VSILFNVVAALSLLVAPQFNRSYPAIV